MTRLIAVPKVEVEKPRFSGSSRSRGRSTTDRPTVTLLRLSLFLVVAGLAVGLAVDLALDFDYGLVRVNRALLRLFIGSLAAAVVVGLFSFNYSPPRITGPSLDRLVAARRARLGSNPEARASHFSG